MTTASLEAPSAEGWRDATEGLVYAYVLDGSGGVRELNWDELESWNADQGPLWVHLDYQDPRAREWLHGDSGVEPVAAEALLEADIRPRFDRFGEAVLAGLRGVNLNPGADPEDMVSVRIWLEPMRAITLRHQRVAAVRDVREALVAGRGPTTIPDLLSLLALRLIARMGPVLARLDDQIDDLEEQVALGEHTRLRARLAENRRLAISLRRHLAPEREVIAEMAEEGPDWFDDSHRQRFRELSERLTRYLEGLDVARERAAVTQEEVSQRLAEDLNRRMLVLALVASVFLPLSLLTGLLGINVGGIPGSGWEGAFWLVGGLLVGLGVAELIWLKRSGWF